MLVSYTCYHPPYSDAYSSDSPEGYVNLGTAVKSLSEDVLTARLHQPDLWRPQPSWQHYMGLNGTQDLLRAAAGFLQQKLAQVSQGLATRHSCSCRAARSALRGCGWSMVSAVVWRRSAGCWQIQGMSS